jgi:hypothetical protein
MHDTMRDRLDRAEPRNSRVHVFEQREGGLLERRAFAELSRAIGRLQSCVRPGDLFGAHLGYAPRLLGIDQCALDRRAAAIDRKYLHDASVR